MTATSPADQVSDAGSPGQATVELDHVTKVFGDYVAVQDADF